MFREAFENAQIGIALVSTRGEWLRVNRKSCEIAGYTAQDLLRTTFQTITHPDDLDTDLGHADDMLSGRLRTYDMEKRYIHKQGRVVRAHLSVSLVRDEQGSPLFFISQVQDITARKAAAVRLRSDELSRLDPAVHNARMR